MTAGIPTDQRIALIRRYVGALHDLGQISLGEVALREHLRVDMTDFWAASPLRESSPWHSRLFACLDRLCGSEPERSTELQAHCRRARLRARTVLHFALSFVSSLKNRAGGLEGEILFVVFMSESSSIVSDREILRRYFGGLPEHLESIGLRPAVLFLPTDSPIARMTQGERRTHTKMHRTLSAEAITCSISPRNVWRALRVWIQLQRQAPSQREVGAALPSDGDLAQLYPLWQEELDQSVCGTSSARNALLHEGFFSALRRAQGIQLIIYPFEGQGWEACLENSARRCGIPTIAYLHTIMKPWDVRAHTSLREAPPQRLALHGVHDQRELSPIATPCVSVEALRYAYLREHREARARSPQSELLVVLGSDCENSFQQYSELMSEIAAQARPWEIAVKSHPQCTQLPEEGSRTRVVTGSLNEALRQCRAVFLCGTAAPLDSYLFGLPTAALSEKSGYSMNPLQPNDAYFVGNNVAEVVLWLDSVMQREFSQPDATPYFDLSEGFEKWTKAIRSVIS